MKGVLNNPKTVGLKQQVVFLENHLQFYCQ
jgi:hypothetical protein